MMAMFRGRAPGAAGSERRGAAARGAAALALGLLIGLGGCSYLGLGDETATPIAEERPVEELFGIAQNSLREGRYQTAILQFEEVERLYPISSYAKRSILGASVAAYRAGEYDKSALSAGRYLEFYPSDEQAPYAQYLIAMSSYDQITDVGRDQARTKAALQALRELINRYPNSEYTREAQLKLDLTLDHLAGKEMSIGRFYLKRGKYIGAINRFRTVVERYQTTTHVPEALHRLVEAYLALGVESEAQTAAAVLGHNFPGSDWYQDSYALLTGRDLRPEVDRGSWMNRAWSQLVEGEWL
ncbi:MAG: outer membrane protein assembly factor BamD [Pseudomonadota bacterium]